MKIFVSVVSGRGLGNSLPSSSIRFPCFHLSPSFSSCTRRDLVPLSRSWNIGPSFKISSTSESKEPKKKREPSKYNIFMSEEIKKIKAENPNMIHKEAFKTAARNWKAVK